MTQDKHSTASPLLKHWTQSRQTVDICWPDQRQILKPPPIKLKGFRPEASLTRRRKIKEISKVAKLDWVNHLIVR